MTDQAQLAERLRELADARRKFVNARNAMNAAIPDPINGTPAERALYDERYRADHEAERELFSVAMGFASWIDGKDAIIAALRALADRREG